MLARHLLPSLTPTNQLLAYLSVHLYQQVPSSSNLTVLFYPGQAQLGSAQARPASSLVSASLPVDFSPRSSLREGRVYVNSIAIIVAHIHRRHFASHHTGYHFFSHDGSILMAQTTTATERDSQLYPLILAWLIPLSIFLYLCAPHGSSHERNLHAQTVVDMV